MVALFVGNKNQMKIETIQKLESQFLRRRKLNFFSIKNPRYCNPRLIFSKT
jgi:hypothetical protein